MATINAHTTRANGTVLTATIYNADHVNHISNAQALNTDKLEGATPPVVDGHVAVFDGTSGAVLRTGGAFPASRATTISAGTGLTGGGDLSANRTIAADFADLATAQAGTSDVKIMSPLRTANYIDNRVASQAEAEAGSNSVKLTTPQRIAQNINARLASQAQAQAGTENTKLMTPLRTAEAIAALGQVLNVGDAQTQFNNSAPWDTGALGSRGGVFLIEDDGSSGHNVEVSANGGTNYATLFTHTSSQSHYALVFVQGDSAVMLLFTETTTPSFTGNISRVALTAGSGNIFFKLSDNDTLCTGIRVL